MSLSVVLQPLVTLSVFALLFVGCSQRPDSPRNQSSAEPAGILIEIRAFLREHKDFGDPRSVESVPDWRQGKRQRVTLETNGKQRSLLFYIKDQEVVTVYENSPDGRKKVWGDYETQEDPTAPVARGASESLPAYTVLYSNTAIATNSKFGDVLIPSFSRKTPAETRERVFKEIATKEGLADISFYSTNDAFKANTSSSYEKSHPNALRTGFLGSLKQGKFTAGEIQFP